jgi:hypothetical protein
VVMGMIALLLNGASYSHNFSTVLRVARGAELSEELRDEDLKGEDPLPKHLADAQVRFGEAIESTVEEVGLRYRGKEGRNER